MEDFKESVRKGFQGCKSDIESLRLTNIKLCEQIERIIEENNSLKDDIKRLNESNVEIKAEMKGMKIALNYIKEFNEKQNLAQQTSLTNSNLESSQQEVVSQIGSGFDNESYNNDNFEKTKTIIVEKPIVSRPAKEKKEIKDPYEALLAFKAKANKREMLKQKMISMVSESGMNLSELKFMFVEHYKYCSKATFYNYLKELEIEKTIRIERENSKNFVYLNRMENHI